jgi:hypothetical protein
MSFSNRSVYLEFPSRSLEPPLPMFCSAGSMCSSCRNLSLNSDDEASERKSLDEKSTEFGGLMVNFRMVDCFRRFSSASERACSSGVNFGPTILSSHR